MYPFLIEKQDCSKIAILEFNKIQDVKKSKNEKLSLIYKALKKAYSQRGDEPAC